MEQDANVLPVQDQEQDNLNLHDPQFIGFVQLEDRPDPILNGLISSFKPQYPDLHRLWGKHFQPAGKPETVVSIPLEWASFFTVQLLNNSKFSWVKDILLSPAWEILQAGNNGH